MPRLITSRIPPMLNPRYTFENFAVASHNQSAAAAARAFASATAQSPMPFFLSAGTGLGKTHLMHAIGHSLYDNYAQIRIGCVSAEYFSNDFQRAADNAGLPAFRRRYCEFDTLLVDDVDYSGGGTRARDELRDTCMALLASSKRIVFTSTRPLSQITALGDFLSSQVGAGTTASITAPDFDARVAILCLKARAMRLELFNWVIECLAGPPTANIRRLEGALLSLVRHATHSGKAINHLEKDFIQGFVRDFQTPYQ